MAGNMLGAMDGFSTQLGNPGMMQASSSGQMVESIPSAAIRRDQGSDLAQRVSTVLRQAWKEDQDAGHLLGSLYEVFGEATPLFNHQRYPCLCRKWTQMGLEVF